MTLSLQRLRLPVKVENALLHWRPDVTAEHLTVLTRGELACLPHVGQAALDVIHDRLREHGFVPSWSPDPEPRPGRRLTPARAELAKIREVLAKTTAGDGAEWFVEHGATRDGRSTVVDGRDQGMHPMYGEAHECDLAALCVNYVTRHVLGVREP